MLYQRPGMWDMGAAIIAAENQARSALAWFRRRAANFAQICEKFVAAERF
jgi:hypothetical protein